MDASSFWIDLGFLVGGLVFLVAGGEGLVRGSTRLALRTGISPLIVGLTIVAFGTSSPELLVSLQAARVGTPAVALGNVVGSNICNIALILGLATLIRPMRVQVDLVRMDVPVMIGASLGVFLMLQDGLVGRGDAGLLFTGIVGYVAFTVVRGRRTPAVDTEHPADVPDTAHGPLWKDVALVIGGLVFLTFGADGLVRGAVALAHRIDVEEAVIGLTIVAVGTSLPELATSVIASLRGEGDIAIGNVVGSNIFNLLCILGATALFKPLPVSGITSVDLAAMMGLAILMLPLMRSGFVLNRWEGTVFLACYAGYLFVRLP